MSSRITFYVVRHGRTLMNTLDRVQGWCDSPLTPEGQQVAKYVGLGMKEIPFRSAYCSTLRRTRQTVDIILTAKGQEDIQPIEIDGFREAGFGSFESGKNLRMWESAAFFLHYKSAEAMYNDLLAGKVTFRAILNAVKELDQFDMAESYEQVEQRTQASLRAIAEEEAAKGDANILVIAHGMSIVAMLLSLGGDKLLKGHLENAAVCKMVYESGTFTVESMNDLSYAERGKQAS
ncbi:MAG: histidine phosphatase family protein [Bacteroidetes bacterium]|nr:histidine phosphatase family protein [Bacteroidota bacterium]